MRQRGSPPRGVSLPLLDSYRRPRSACFLRDHSHKNGRLPVFEFSKYSTGKKTLGGAGTHEGHTGTRITQTNLTTNIPTHQRTHTQCTGTVPPVPVRLVRRQKQRGLPVLSIALRWAGFHDLDVALPGQSVSQFRRGPRSASPHGRIAHARGLRPSRLELIGGSGRTAGRYASAARAFISPTTFEQARGGALGAGGGRVGLIAGVNRSWGGLF